MSEQRSSTHIAVVGAGAWGTALAVHLASRAHAMPRVTLCFRDPAQMQAAAKARENVRYLPGIALPASLLLAADAGHAQDADIVIVATPVAALEAVAAELAGRGVRAPLLWLCKGFIESAQAPGGAWLAHQVIAPRWPSAVGVISGPSFAAEVARAMPTALAIAATEPALARTAAALLRADTLRAYESDDIVSVEVGGAVKNVLAIAAGASDGLGFGHNARAALITRGLAEIARLAVALGGRRETLMGLAGLGDLVLTCTGDLSRNRRVGLALAKGETLAAILAGLQHVAEGVGAARAAHGLAGHLGIDMPVTDAVYGVLHQGVGVRDAVESLLRREPRREDAG
jgi:glycerol-3-phosphate dehydrogenase (NAD(P)+)